MQEKIIKQLLKETNKAILLNEIPVGCVITKNSIVVSKAHNSKEHDNKITSHAEIKAIIKASKCINDWRLNDFELYTTLMPCPMCASAIVQSRIKKVYYIYSSNNINDNKISEQILSVCELIKLDESILSSNIIKDFFINIRNNNVSRET